MKHYLPTVTLRSLVITLPIVALAACSDGGNFAFGSRDATNDGPVPIGATRLVERDVEAPEVFEAFGEGLWDGRPTLGGVWVAHPDVQEPERVIIRNQDNSHFVIGALFPRERSVGAPEIQVSSDAAAALEMLAGAPVGLSVTALRREEAAQGPEAPLDDVLQAEPGPIAVLDRPNSNIDTTLAPEPQPAIIEAAPSPTPPPIRSDLERPYVQIGIFSVQENANNTGQALRRIGLEPTIYDQGSSDRQFWRVVVGPADSVETRAAILENVRGLGFDDAFFVSR